MLKRELDGGNIIHISKINPILRWSIRIPRKYHTTIINEMVSCHLLKHLSRDDYELLYCSKKPLCDSLGEPLWSD